MTLVQSHQYMPIQLPAYRSVFLRYTAPFDLRQPFHDMIFVVILLAYKFIQGNIAFIFLSTSPTVHAIYHLFTFCVKHLHSVDFIRLRCWLGIHTFFSNFASAQIGMQLYSRACSALFHSIFLAREILTLQSWIAQLKFLLPKSLHYPGK